MVISFHYHSDGVTELDRLVSQTEGYGNRVISWFAYFLEIRSAKL